MHEGENRTITVAKFKEISVDRIYVYVTCKPIQKFCVSGARFSTSVTITTRIARVWSARSACDHVARVLHFHHNKTSSECEY